MIALPEDQKIDALLSRVFGGRPPQADFSSWREQHPDAVAMLLSRAATARETGAARVSAGEPRTWLAGRRLRFALLSAAALAATLAFVWAGWLHYAGGRAGAIAEKQESDEMPPSAQDARPDAAREILTERVREMPPSARDAREEARRLAKWPWPGQILMERAREHTRTVLARFPPDWMRVAESSAIVRVMATAKTGNTLVCRPIRVIYGRIPDEPLVIERFRPVEQDFKTDREVIVYLAGYRQGDGTMGLRSNGMTLDVPDKYPLDRHEQDLISVIAGGSFLFLPSISPDDLSSFVERSDIILRARLTKVGEESSEWEVAGDVLRIVPPGRDGAARAKNKDLQQSQEVPVPATVAVSLDPWRLRAESIVRYRAARQPGQSFAREEVRKEFARLVRGELQAGREAVLLLRSPEHGKEKGAYEPVGILREDPAHPKRLDQAIAVIRDIVGQGSEGSWRSRF